MNILILSWRGPKHPMAGGAELSTYKHAVAWVKAGHNVMLFTSHYKGAKRSEVLDGIKIKRYGFQYLGVHVAAFVWYVFGIHEKFDLIVDQFHGIPFFTPLYTRVPKLAFIHEVAKEVWYLYPWPHPFNLIFGWVGKELEPFVFKLYKRIQFMTVSESTKTDLIDFGIPRKNVAVIYNGIDAPKIKIIKNKVKTIVYLGALTMDKGAFDAVHIFKLMANTNSKWNFWVIGEGPSEFIKKLKSVYVKAKFWGRVPNYKKFELLSKSHVLINPSIREGWGLVNIEAAAMGCPVVGYRVPGVKDSVLDGETGALCKFGDLQCMADEAIALLKDNKKYKLMSIAARKRANKFSWESSTKESLKLISILCSK